MFFLCHTIVSLCVRGYTYFGWMSFCLLNGECIEFNFTTGHSVMVLLLLSISLDFIFLLPCVLQIL